jgi:KDO2-lipid IV(A) lauroyltransferase
LAIRYQVPLVVLGVARLPGGLRYRIAIEDVIDPADYEARPDAVPAITQRFTAGLERLVRQAPEQYFWLHRRWKNQPKARPIKTAA